MNLTGHKSLEIVQRYAHLTPDFPTQAVSVLDDLYHNLDTAEESGNMKKALSH